MDSLLTFMAGWLSTLSGVALGGWLVYRTKRDSYDSLFSRDNKGASFNLDDDFSTEEPVNPDLPKATAAANGDFMNQFAEKLAKR